MNLITTKGKNQIDLINNVHPHSLHFLGCRQKVLDRYLSDTGDAQRRQLRPATEAVDCPGVRLIRTETSSVGSTVGRALCPPHDVVLWLIQANIHFRSTELMRGAGVKFQLLVTEILLERQAGVEFHQIFFTLCISYTMRLVSGFIFINLQQVLIIYFIK